MRVGSARSHVGQHSPFILIRISRTGTARRDQVLSFISSWLNTQRSQSAPILLGSLLKDRHVRRTPTHPRLFVLACTGLTLLLSQTSTLHAQSASSKKEPPPPDTTPLARYVPREQVLFHLELDGLAAHQEAWRETSTYKMLTDTPLGAMLEEVGGQVFERLLKDVPGRKITGRETVKLLKHLGQSGFQVTFVSVPDHPAKSALVVVLRGAAQKDIREAASRLIVSFGEKGAKPTISKRPTGRQVVLMKGGATGGDWTWWPENNDIVIASTGVEAADLVAEVLDGKRPNAVDHPIRVELQKGEGVGTSVAIAFLDAKATGIPGPLGSLASQLNAQGIQQVDVQWGLSEKALVTSARIQAPAPRKGLMALADQPTFDRKTLLALPDDVQSFSAISIDPAKALDLILETARSTNPAAADSLEQSLEMMKVKTRLQLRKDILAHLGPKAIYYVAPPSASSPVARAKTAAGSPAMNPFSLPFGTTAVPRFALLIELKNHDAFERSLDMLMIELNKSIRDQFHALTTPPAAENSAEAPGEGETPGTAQAPTAPPIHDATPEFRLMSGAGKAYAFSVPSKIGRLPAGFRPTIRLGEKHLVIASSPDVAKQSLEVKQEVSWIPPDEVGSVIELAPEGLIYLKVDDQREALSKFLATLPGELQKLSNLARIPAVDSPAGKTSPEEGAPDPAAPGQDALAAEAAAAVVEPEPAAPGDPGMPADAGAPGTPAPARPINPFLLRVDPAKLPSDTALQEHLFPSMTAVSVDSQGVRYTRRVAFPVLISPNTTMLKGMIGYNRAAIDQAIAAAEEKRNPKSEETKDDKASPAPGSEGVP